MRFNPGCECCEGDVTDCACCETIPRTLYVTFAGISPGELCACVEDTDTFELTYIGSCQWRHYSEGTPLCANGNVCWQRVTASCGVDGSWGLEVAWFGAFSGQDCPGGGGLTFTLSAVTFGGDCDPVSVDFGTLTHSGAPFSGCVMTAVMTE